MSEWQPIETAPIMDDVLIWGDGYLKPLMGWRSNGDARWRVTCSSFDDLAQPTHWQPLPAPPVAHSGDPT